MAATAVGVLAAPVIAGAALGAAGFTSAGVAAGSVAAGVQSAVYGGSVAAGSLFALCQSAGATGCYWLRGDCFHWRCWNTGELQNICKARLFA